MGSDFEYRADDVSQDTSGVLPSDNVCDLVEYVVSNLVDDPDEITIDITDDVDSSLIEIHVAPDDIGKVIGRRGRVIKSVRTLARACGARDHITAEVEVLV